MMSLTETAFRANGNANRFNVQICGQTIEKDLPEENRNSVWKPFRPGTSLDGVVLHWTIEDHVLIGGRDRAVTIGGKTPNCFIQIQR